MSLGRKRSSLKRILLLVALTSSLACTAEPIVPPVLPPPPSFPPPALTPQVAPPDAAANVGDSVFYRITNTTIPATAWRWRVSDSAIAAIDSVTGAAVARRLGPVGVRGCATDASGSVCATTILTVH